MSTGLPVAAAVAIVGCGGHRAAMMAGAGSVATRDACVAGSATPRFLIFHWSPREHETLDRAMSGGLAVVSVGCDRVRLLPGCHLDGLYQYFGMTPTEHALRLDEGEQLVNLAFGDDQAASGHAPLEARVVKVGRMITTRRTGGGSRLTGDCGRATHFVRSVSVGVASGGTQATPRLAACAAADPVASLPPVGCRTPVAVELAPLDEGGRSAGDGANAYCPAGWVFGRGKCTLPGPRSVFDCSDDVRECTDQCASGSGSSCNRLGYLFATGRATGKRDRRRAAELYATACGLRDPPGCFNLGVYEASEVPPEGQSVAPGELWRRACEGGFAPGCSNLGVLYARGDSGPPDPARALAYFTRACIGGDDAGCVNAGAMCLSRGGTDDDQRALLMFAMACEGGNAQGCSRAAELVRRADQPRGRLNDAGNAPAKEGP